MPELPEVETIKRGLEEMVVGKRVVGIETEVLKLMKPSLEKVREAVLGAKIKKIGRRGKFLQLYLDNGWVLGVHLKMTGRLLVRKKGERKDVWQHVLLKMQNKEGKGRADWDWELRFCDLRKFGWVKLFSKKSLEQELAKYGPEPLDDLTLGGFAKFLASTRRAVKVALLDQAKIAGVGNIYSNDALFLAGIDPRRAANSLVEEEVKRLFEALEEVLRRGLKYGGASDNHYLNARGEKGDYQKHFLVYGMVGKKCRKCGAVIKRVKLGGRGTFFCPKCQK